jgi:predicted RND superfamily exporter protein
VIRLRSEGKPLNEAIIEGGRTRVRPILMTAFATILALIPLAAGFNEGSIIAAELGTVVIGGLFSSTLLTLLVVPVVYSLLEGSSAVRGAPSVGSRNRCWKPKRRACRPIDGAERWLYSGAPMKQMYHPTTSPRWTRWC